VQGFLFARRQPLSDLASLLRAGVPQIPVPASTHDAHVEVPVPMLVPALTT
jgi:hypothetical protein